MTKNKKFLQKTTHLTINLRVWCTGTLKYVGCTVEFVLNKRLKCSFGPLSI